MTPWELACSRLDEDATAAANAQLRNIEGRLRAAGMDDAEIGKQITNAKRLGDKHGRDAGFDARDMDDWQGIDEDAIRIYRKAGATDEFVELLELFASVAFWRARHKYLFHTSPECC